MSAGGSPVTGLYDFTFNVFSVEAGGASLAGPVVLAAVAVTNGLFNVSLDFGAGIFSGAARWLEIKVRLNGAPTFTTLGTRQSLLPTPYAIFAKTAGSVVNGTVTANQLNTVGPPPAPGQFLSYDGGNLAWTAPGVAAGNIWSLNGSIAYYNAGNVGIGTATPGVKFVVADGGGQLGFSSVYIRAGILGGGNGAELDLQGGWSDNDGGRLRLGGSARGDADRNVVQFFQNNLERMRINDGGNVGIGTAAPQAKLHLFNSADSVTHLIETAGGVNAWAQLRFKNANGEWVAGTSRAFNNDMFYLDRLGNSSLEFQLTANGNLGLGVEPQAKLHLFDPNSISHRIQTGGGTNAWTRVDFANANGEWNVGTSRGFNNDQFYIYRQGATENAFAVQPNGDAFVQCNARQRFDRGGFVKAMLRVNYLGGVDSCFNGNNNTSSSGCGIIVTKPLGDVGVYRINFGFPVSDRFVSITANYASAGLFTAKKQVGANYRRFDSTSVEVFTFATDDAYDTTPAEFTLILY